MTTFKRHIDTALLPDDIFSYTDMQFYNIAKQIVGASAMELLEIQGIRCPESFLLIPDVFAILDIKCADLNCLREKLCLKSDDDTYVVKPGIKSIMNYFRELIMKKYKNMKISSKNKGSNSTMSLFTAAPHVTNETFSTQEQQSTSLTIARTSMLNYESFYMIPINENSHRNFIINSINKWCEKHYSGLSLTEGVDYYLIFTIGDDRNFIAKIKCGCGSKISL
ncbi:unnamed protein product, partial [Rotaria magnacalcarata]